VLGRHSARNMKAVASLMAGKPTSVRGAAGRVPVPTGIRAAAVPPLLWVPLRRDGDRSGQGGGQNRPGSVAPGITPPAPPPLNATHSVPLDGIRTKDHTGE
jgi:hypothetical protein